MVGLSAMVQLSQEQSTPPYLESRATLARKPIRLALFEQCRFYNQYQVQAALRLNQRIFLASECLQY